MAHRIGFFLFILFFAGSVVLLAANELRHFHSRLNRGDTETAKRLIEALRGDTLQGMAKEETYLDPTVVPQRRKGQYLQTEDSKRLNSMLKKVLPRSTQEGENEE